MSLDSLLDRLGAIQPQPHNEDANRAIDYTLDQIERGRPDAEVLDLIESCRRLARVY